MRVLDSREDNFISDNFSLITNINSYNQSIIFGRPFIAHEHSIIYVRRGTSNISISYNNYTLREGHLLIVPANSVLINKSQSNDHSVYSIAFRFPEVEHLGLIDCREIHTVLPDNGRKVVEKYYELINQLIHSINYNIQGINHLIISLLYEINTFYQNHDGSDTLVQPNRSQEIMNGFMRLILEQQYPIRKPGYYAEKLNITKGYLADVIKEESGKTIMTMINERTILLAQAMLASSDEKVESIGNKLFFSDASQFVKFFKKHTGETPNEYRRRMKLND